MGTIAITGSAGGIMSALRTLLEKDGHRVIGIDIHEADVVVDLSVPASRQAMVDEVTALSGGSLDGVVAGAGITRARPDAPGSEGDVVAINYFGAVATLEGLRPLLADSSAARAVGVSSNATTSLGGMPRDVVELCLDGDEESAIRRIEEIDTAGLAYGASKLALARWVRRSAPMADWAGSGILLNAVCPGLTDTPMVADLKDGLLAGESSLYPLPLRRAAEPSEIASVIAFLLSREASFCCGSVFFVDGGTDAAVRPDDWPAPPSYA